MNNPPDEVSDLPEPRTSRWNLGGSAFIVGVSVLLLILSWDFTDSVGSARATWILTGLLVSAGAVYVALVRQTDHRAGRPMSLPWLVGVGVAMRLALLFSEPMWEVDYYRYMWDGAVLASGHNPYRYSPEEVQAKGEAALQVPEALRKLGEAPGSKLADVQYGNLRTVYPPVAQVVFAAAHLIRPWSLSALRLVLLLFDAATLVLLLLLLRKLGLPAALLAVYWWNPLLVKETVNSAHMDVIVLPFVLGAVLLAVRKRPLLSALLLALAVGTKLWPVVLLPVLLRPWFREPRKLVPALAIFAAACAAIFLPVFTAGLDESSGFVAYGERWQMNDSLFMLFDWTAQAAVWVVGADAAQGKVLARIIAAAFLAAWVVRMSWRPAGDAIDLCEKCLYVLAALFLLSPTQFPWYYMWMLPFIAIRPRTSLLLLTPLLPIYYLRFYFTHHVESVTMFDYGIVWLEFVPVWILLVLEWRRARRAGGVAALRRAQDGDTEPVEGVAALEVPTQ